MRSGFESEQHASGGAWASVLVIARGFFTMPPKKILGEKRLTAEEKKRKEEKEKREKEKERKERKAQLAADRTFGLKNKNISAKVQARVEELQRDAPTKEAERARAEARAREKKKQKEAEEQAKLEMEILMGTRSALDTRRPRAANKEDDEDEDDLADDMADLDVSGEPRRSKKKGVSVDDDEEESHKLTEDERREILAKLEQEKLQEKIAELKAAASEVNPFHVDDEGWYESDEDPIELLRIVAGNKRAIIMPRSFRDKEAAAEDGADDQAADMDES